MAANDFYVDAAAGSNNNGGTSAGAAIVSGASADTDGTAVVALSDDTPDLSGVSVGDCIRLAAEGGGIRSSDIFEITAVDDGADTVTVTPTPGSNLNQAWAIGGAWATIGKAAGILRATDTDHVWVKGGTSYTDTTNLVLAMNASTPATFEGYTTTTGDGGVFTIDGESIRANGFTDSLTANGYYIFKNMRATNHTVRGIDFGMDNCVCKNCQFDNNSSGALVDNYWRFEECSFNDNSGGTGCRSDANTVFIGCKAYRNGNHGLHCDSGLCFGCVCYSHAGNGIQFDGIANAFCIAINCTVDGDAKDVNTGINLGPSFYCVNVCINNIIYDCITGMDSIAGQGEILVSRNNLLNNNTDNYSGGAATHVGEQTGAPAFTDEASQDYTLTSGSPAKGAGFDGSQLEGDSSGMDIGARQRIETGGGLLSPNKRAGKQ